MKRGIVLKLYLEKIINKKLNLVHFIGIGGTSMSGLALILKNKGVGISGSDMKASTYTEKLIKHGAKIFIGHNEKNINSNCDLVVYSAAINPKNPEMIKAKELNIPLMERSDFLGALTKDFPKTIAVAGTHGKTTTSSLVASLLYNGNLDPTVSIGGSLDLIGGNCRVGDGDFFVTEACEYVDSFLKSHHNMGIILNIEEDHLDYFKDIEHIKKSFHSFAKIIPKDGLLIANSDDKDVRDILKGLDCPIVTIGLKDNNQWRATNIEYDNLGKPSFDIYNEGNLFGNFSLNIPGEHNVINALASLVCANHLGINKDIMDQTLSNFIGAHRRFEFRGDINNIRVYEDYAHHPTELKVTVEACTNYEYNKLWVVFQSHTYSRTYYFFDDFVNSFKGADYVIINDIYSDREDNTYNIYAQDLAKAVEERLNIPTKHISEFKDIVSYILDNATENDFILVAGSQTINQVAFDLVEALKIKYE